MESVTTEWYTPEEKMPEKNKYLLFRGLSSNEEYYFTYLGLEMKGGFYQSEFGWWSPEKVKYWCYVNLPKNL